MPQLTKGICQVIPTDWKELSEMPQRAEGNLSSCLTDEQELFKMPQLTQGICEVIPADWQEISNMSLLSERNLQVIPTQLVGNIQDSPTDRGKFVKLLLQLIGRNIKDAPTDRKNQSGYPTDWPELSKIIYPTDCGIWQVIPTDLAGNIQDA